MSRVIISYDVFDTVVTRAFAHPRDVFVHLGECLGQRGIITIDAGAFARTRWTGELAARQKAPGREVSLDEIYREIAARLRWDAAATAAARDLELEIESRHLHGIPSVRDELARARDEAGRLVFLSDMYLPSAVLRKWLMREGVMQAADVLLISGEARVNKNSGGLFHIARQQLDVEFARWRHAGDHPVSDFAKPRELGLAATHRTEAWLTPREQLARGTSGEFAPVWRSLLAGAMRLARLARPAANAREALLQETGADVTGPLFYGFVRWVLTEAEKRGVRRLYFLARDGQIFWRIAHEIQAGKPDGIECIYLQVSRLLFAGISEMRSPAALRTLVAPAGVFHSMRQALLVLGLDEAWATANLPARFRSLDLDANLPPVVREALADWLLDAARVNAIHAALTQRSVQTRAYLEAAGLRANEPIALVDAGWFGTIQRSLEHVLGDTGPAALTGFYLGVMPPGSRPFAGEALGYTNHFSPLPLLREESHKVLIELMARADHGQVTGLVHLNDHWTVQLQVANSLAVDEVRLFQETVLAFTRRMLAVSEISPTPKTLSRGRWSVSTGICTTIPPNVKPAYGDSCPTRISI